MIQLTGSGHVHRVYRRPRVEDVPYIGNRQKTWIGGRQYNLDVRGDGGYIMAPGSIHPTTGQLYRGRSPVDAGSSDAMPGLRPDVADL